MKAAAESKRGYSFSELRSNLSSAAQQLVKMSFASLGLESQRDGRKLRRRAIGQDVEGLLISKRQTFSDLRENPVPCQNEAVHTGGESVNTERCFALHPCAKRAHLQMP